LEAKDLLPKWPIKASRKSGGNSKSNLDTRRLIRFGRCETTSHFPREGQEKTTAAEAAIPQDEPKQHESKQDGKRHFYEHQMNPDFQDQSTAPLKIKNALTMHKG